MHLFNGVVQSNQLQTSGSVNLFIGQYARVCSKALPFSVAIS